MAQGGPFPGRTRVLHGQLLDRQAGDTEEGPREESDPVGGPQESNLESNTLKTEPRGRLAPSSSHLPWGQEGCGWDVDGFRPHRFLLSNGDDC